MKKLSGNIFRKFFSNLSYAVFSNMLVMLVSLLTNLVVPKILGVEEYSYWQLYLFYSLFIGFLHFGWCDGIYLKYGGQDYQSLDKSSLNGQFYLLFLLQFFFAAIIYIFSVQFTQELNRKFVFSFVGLSLISTNMRWMLIYILQASNRIKDYSKIMILDRVLYVLCIIAIIIFGYKNFKLMIIADFGSRTFSLLYGAYLLFDITRLRIKSFKFDLAETFENVKSGIKLMFAKLASILMLASIRFGVERAWDLKTFGKISLTLSAAKLMMVFINAVGVVLYPVLRKLNKEHLASTYTSIRIFLSVLLLGVLVLYFPVQLMLNYWLPDYKEGLVYLVFVFPICFFEGKMALLNNTYLNVIRKERLLMLSNVYALGLGILLTFTFTVLYRDLDLLMASVIVILASRSIIAEYWLSLSLKINIVKDIIVEIVLVTIFVFSGWFLKSYFSTLIYAVVYSLFVAAYLSRVKASVKYIQKISRLNEERHQVASE